jgi:hypothetical protein
MLLNYGHGRLGWQFFANRYSQFVKDSGDMVFYGGNSGIFAFHHLLPSAIDNAEKN